jgi:hypothetical protein
MKNVVEKLKEFSDQIDLRERFDFNFNISKPYELEMLLFTIADKEIFKDLKERIKITSDKK